MEESNWKVTAFTRFTEDYRVSRKPENYSCINQARSSGGRDIVFAATGNNGVDVITTLYNSGTGYEKTTLEPNAGIIKSGKTESGKIILFMSVEKSLYYAVETEKGSGKFGQHHSISLPQPFNPKKITRLIAKQLETGCLIAAVTATEDTDSYYVTYGIWRGEEPPEFHMIAIPFSSDNGDFLVKSDGTLQYILTGANCAVYDCPSRRIRVYEASYSEEHPDDVILPRCTRAVSSMGIDLVLSVLTYCSFEQGSMTETNCLGSVILDEEKGTYSLRTYEKDVSMKSFEIVSQDNNSVENPEESGFEVQLTALSQDEGCLLHGCLSCLTGKDEIVWQYGQMLEMSTDKLVHLFPSKKDHALRCYCCLKEGGIAVMSRDSESSDWNTDKIELPAEDMVTVVPCYTTEITYADTDGKKLDGMNVEVWSKEAVQIETEKGFFSISQTEHASLTTDAEGKITLIQTTDTLCPSELCYKIPALSSEIFCLDQSDRILQTFKTATPDLLYNAKKDDGSYLLSGQYRTQENAQALAQALQTTAGSIQTDQGIPFQIQGSAEGLRLMTKNRLMGKRCFRCLNQDMGFILSNQDGKLVYEESSAAEVLKQISLMESQDCCADGLFSKLFSKIGDAVRHFVTKVAHVVKVAVAAVVNGIKVAVRAVINGITYVFSQVINLLKQVFDVVLSIFLSVAVLVVDLLAWLGILFHWDEILYMKKAIEHTMQQSLLLLEKGGEKINERIQAQMDSMKTQVTGAFALAKAQISPDQKPFGVRIHETEEANPVPPAVAEASSNNFLLMKLKRTEITVPLSEKAEERRRSGIYDTLEKLIADSEQKGVFSELMDALKTILDFENYIYENPLAELLDILEKMAVSVLELLEKCISLIFHAFSELVREISDLIFQPLDLPFFTSLWKYITNRETGKEEEISLAGISALILALPLSLISKAVLGKAVIKTQADADEYCSYVNAERLLPVFSEAEVDCRDQAVPSGLLQCTRMINGFASFLSSGFSAVNDYGLSMNLPFDPDAGKISVISAISSDVSWCTGIPVLYGDNVNAWQWVQWGGEAIPLMVDWYAISTDGRGISASKEWPEAFMGVWGVAHLILSCVALSETKGSQWYEWMEGCCGSVAEISRFGCYKPVLSSTGHKSAYVTLTLDAVAAVSSCIAMSLDVGTMEKEQVSYGEF